MNLKPQEVVPVLRKHLLTDGYDKIVVDLDRSQGNTIYDSLNGRTYLDMFGYFATVPVGHNHPATQTPDFKQKLLRAALNKPSNSDFYTTELAEFVQVFSDQAMPESLPHLFLVSGGALAVENALKAAFDWKVRKNLQKGLSTEKGTQIIHFREAFHGRSGYTLSLTNTEPAKIKYFPKFNWPRVTNPKLSFPLTPKSLEQVAALEQQSLAEIKQAIHENPNDIAAIILEPIQGEGGDNHFRKEFFQELRDLADENEVMLILDEIQTGAGLTGKMWCYQHFGIEPDMISFGKKTQVCGFMCSRRIDEVDDHVFSESSRINSTWGGNLADMVRFQKHLEIIVMEDLVKNAAMVGKYFLQQLTALAEEFPDTLSAVRGRGLMLAFDLQTADVRRKCLNSFFEQGLIALACGERSIRFRPALNLTRETVDEAVAIMQTALKQLCRGAARQVAA